MVSQKKPLCFVTKSILCFRLLPTFLSKSKWRVIYSVIMTSLFSLVITPIVITTWLNCCKAFWWFYYVDVFVWFRFLVCMYHFQLLLGSIILEVWLIAFVELRFWSLFLFLLLLHYLLVVIHHLILLFHHL